MKFGVLFASSQHPPWSQHYIDYHHLKKLLHLLFDQSSIGELQSSLASEGASSHLGLYYGSHDNNDGLTASHSGVFIEDPATFPLHHPFPGGNDVNSLPLLQDNLVHGSEPMTSRDFQRELNQEIQKAVLFIIQSMGELAEELASLMTHQKTMAPSIKPLLEMKSSTNRSTEQSFIQVRSKEIFDLRMEFLVRIGNKLLLLLEFVELNVEAVTKIVKKHDKQYARWESNERSHGRRRTHSISSYQEHHTRYERLRRQYLPRFARFSSDPNIRCLFLLAADAGDCFCSMSVSDQNMTRNKESDGSFGGWDVMQWNLERSLRELFDWTEGLKCAAKGSSVPMEDDTEAAMENAVLLNKRSKSMSARHSHDNLQQKKYRPRSNSRSSFLGLDTLASMARLVSPDDTPTKSSGSFFEPILYRIQYTRRRLGQTTDRYSRMVYAHEMLHIIDDKHIKDEDDKFLIQMSKGKELEGDEGKWMEEGVPLVSGLSKFLNLMSSGLYMCNYVSYIFWRVSERLLALILSPFHPIAEYCCAYIWALCQVGKNMLIVRSNFISRVK
jgi:hypothetical protein